MKIIFHKEYGPCNYLSVNLHYPHIGFYKVTNSDYTEGKLTGFSFTAATEFWVEKDEDWTRFGILILGFGISIVRQFDY